MQHLIIAGLGWFTLLGYLVTTLEFMVGNRQIPKLSEMPLIDPGAHLNLPRVSIVIPARNEARGIEEALTSVLHLDYPDYELIVLNDRSEDETGAILDSMSLAYPQLKVVHIQHLPLGWLGKNHALYEGAKAANGELLLFTDADIVMRPDSLRRTVHYLQSRQLDHLAVMPELLSRSLDLSLFLGAFGIFFFLYSRPWQAKNPTSKSFIGIGAYNLLRKSIYEAIGTHRAIAMRPDDDMKLGKLIKKHGYRQDVGNGAPMVRVEWYHSLSELVQGLMKNAFAGLDYSLPRTLSGVFAQFLFGVWPVLALFLTNGPTWWLYLGCVVLMQLLCLDNALRYRMNPLTGLAFPVCTLLMIYIILRATALTLIQDGIDWRGTRYSLSELRKNRV